MDPIAVNIDSLLFNELFLRLLVSLPLLLTLYVLFVVYKQYKQKFKGKPILSDVVPKLPEHD